MGKKLLKRSAAVILMLMVLSTGLVANAEGTYTVEKGDCLKKIAQSVYGDPGRWKDIYEANKTSIKNPDIIYKGQVLILPDAVSVRTEDSEETIAADTAMTLEQWTMSEECRSVEEWGNEMMKEAGIVFALKADGNILVYEFTFKPEIWGGLTAEEIASFLRASDLDGFMASEWEEIAESVEEFDMSYNNILDGMRIVFFAPDGTPVYSYDMAFYNM